MKANKIYISLETAKLLKDCGMESKYSYRICEDANGRYDTIEILKTDSPFIDTIIPAFTWQEILWKYDEEFFENGYIIKHTQKILLMIQAKLYDEADLYFRKNCILINKK